MLGSGAPAASKKRKDSQAALSAAAAEANAVEALAALSAGPHPDTSALECAAAVEGSHSDTQTETECSSEHADDPAAAGQPKQQARKRRKHTRQPATAGATAAVPGISDLPLAAESCRHASGVAKKVVEAADGSCSVQLAHRLSSKSAATNNFWLHMPSNLARRCFKDLPCDVDILLTVDGQPPEPERSGRIKSTVRRRPGRSEYYIAGCSSALSTFKNYTVAEMSVNSSASELTLHLQSPSVTQAAAAAEQEEVAAAVETARADAAAAGITGWHECKGTKKVIAATSKRSLLRVPAALVCKAYPVPLPAKFKVDLTCYKDNVLVGTRLGAALTPDRKNYDKSSYSVLLSEDLQQQLAGCAVICHRGAPPYHLQICFSSGQRNAADPAADPPGANISSNPAQKSPDHGRTGTAAGPAAATAAGAAAVAPSPAAADNARLASDDAGHRSVQHRKHQSVVSRAAHKRSRIEEDGTASCRWFPWAGPSASAAGAAAAGSSASAAAVPVCRLGGIRGVNGAAARSDGGRQQQVQVVQHS